MLKEQLIAGIKAKTDSVTYSNPYPSLAIKETLAASEGKFLIDVITQADFEPLVRILSMANVPLREYQRQMESEGLLKKIPQDARHRNERTRAGQEITIDTHIPHFEFNKFVIAIAENPSSGEALNGLIRHIRKQPPEKAAKLTWQALTYLSLSGKEQSDFFIRENLWKHRIILDALDDIGQNPYLIHPLETIFGLYEAENYKEIVVSGKKNELSQKKREVKKADKKVAELEKKNTSAQKTFTDAQKLYNALELYEQGDGTEKELKDALKVIKKQLKDAKDETQVKLSDNLPTYVSDALDRMNKARLGANTLEDDVKAAKKKQISALQSKKDAMEAFGRAQFELYKNRTITDEMTVSLDSIFSKFVSDIEDMKREGKNGSAQLCAKKLKGESGAFIKKIQAAETHILDIYSREYQYDPALLKKGSRITKTHAVGLISLGFALSALGFSDIQDSQVNEVSQQSSGFVYTLHDAPREQIETSVPKKQTSDFDRLVLPEFKAKYLVEKANAEWNQFSEHSIIIPKGGATLLPDQINYILDVINHDLGRPEASPAAGLQLGQFIYERCIFYNIDPAIVLAFYNHESQFGTLGIARDTLSTGNIRFLADDPLMSVSMNTRYGFDLKAGDNSGYVDYTKFTGNKKEALMMAFEHKLRLLREYYIEDTSPKMTIESILPKYAPPSENKTEVYKNSMISFADYLRFTYGNFSREDQSKVEPSGNPLGDADFTITQGCNGDVSHKYNDLSGKRKVCGVDLVRADEKTYGAPVYATSSGEINFTSKTSYGNLAIIHYFNPFSYEPHDTLYGHLKDFAPGLVEGQWVKKGALLGYIGDTGWVQPKGEAGSHLHYSFYGGEDGLQAIDPEPSLYSK